MGSVNIIVIVESIRSLIAKNDDNDFNLTSILAVGAALGDGTSSSIANYC